MLKRLISLLMTWALVVLPLSAREDKKETDRLDNCGTVLKEILDIPDDIPPDLLNKAECVIIYPSVIKGAFIVGASYGRGAMTCRTGEHFTGPWGAPTMMALEGGSVGFQLGGQATDFVLLVMNPRGAKAILHSKVKLGANASAAAGPKGRDAEAATQVELGQFDPARRALAVHDHDRDAVSASRGTRLATWATRLLPRPAARDRRSCERRSSSCGWRERSSSDRS